MLARLVTPRRRSRLVTPVLVLGALVCAACGEEVPPDAGEMTLRELLGLAPEHVEGMSEGERAAFTEALRDEWERSVAAPDEPAAVELADTEVGVDQPSISPLVIAREHDRARAARGLDVRVSARIDAEGTSADIRTTPLPLDLLGVAVDSRAGTIDVRPLQPDEPIHRGELRYDPGWGAVEVNALYGASERQAVERLEPIVRRYLYQMGLTTETAQVVRAERAPVALWYASAHRAVLINPNLLYLLSAPGPDAQPTAVRSMLVTTTFAITPAFIEACVDDQVARCNACFGDTGDPSSSACGPIFPPDEATDETAHARGECESLADDDGAGFELLCYHFEIVNNLGCVLERDTENRCGVAGAPYGSVAALENLRPVRVDDTCQEILRACREGRVSEPTPSDDPPPVTDDDSDEAADALDACVDCFGSCASADLGGCEGGDGGEGGGGCEGDGLDGADACCEGDASATGSGRPTASIVDGRSWQRELVLALPFLFLLAVYWRSRSLDGSVSSVEAPDSSG